MRLIYPRIVVRIRDSFPLFYLAGPIQGGDEWQVRACEFIASNIDDVDVVVPNWWNAEHPLIKKYGATDVTATIDDAIKWERAYLYTAGLGHFQRGCIIVWVPDESKTRPRDDNSPYGRDTYGEIAEWRGRMLGYADLRRPENEWPRMVVGAEGGFPGLPQIRKNFSFGLNNKYQIYETLAETVLAAFKKAGIRS